MNLLKGEAIYSQHGEDAMVLELLPQLGGMPEVCVEIGANDGIDLSNTACLWKDRGWYAVLVESNPKHAQRLLGNVSGYAVDILINSATPENINDMVPEACSVLSIDIDDCEYQLIEALEHIPRVLITEYNPTIPYWVDVYGKPGDSYGASVTALVRLCKARGLHLAGATGCNLVFVDEQQIASQYETNLEAIIGRGDLTYLTTDYNGHPYPIGPLCFGLAVDGHEHPYGGL